MDAAKPAPLMFSKGLGGQQTSPATGTRGGFSAVALNAVPPPTAGIKPRLGAAAFTSSGATGKSASVPRPAVPTTWAKVRGMLLPNCRCSQYCLCGGALCLRACVRGRGAGGVGGTVGESSVFIFFFVTADFASFPQTMPTTGRDFCRQPNPMLHFSMCAVEFGCCGREGGGGA